MADALHQRLGTTPCRAAQSVAALQAEQHHRDALRLVNESKHEDAYARFQDAIRLNPRVPEYHHNQGVALARQSKLEEAIASFQEAVKLQPDSADTLNNLGLA